MTLDSICNSCDVLGYCTATRNRCNCKVGVFKDTPVKERGDGPVFFPVEVGGPGQAGQPGQAGHRL